MPDVPAHANKYNFLVNGDVYKVFIYFFYKGAAICVV